LIPKIVATAVLMVGLTFAQSTQPVSSSDSDQSSQSNPPSQADQSTQSGQQAPAQPVMQNSLLAPQPSQSADSQQSDDQYQGPTILSRDKGLIGERGGKLLDFRLFGEITGVYDSGLVPILTNSNGNAVPLGGAAYGYTLGGGLIGSKTWRHDKLKIEYNGNYQNYVNHSLFNGSNQFLNLEYSRQLTRHVTLNLKETAGTSILANGYYSYLPLTNTDLFAVPANELFDNRTNFLQSRVDLTWQKTARLSFSVGGEGYLVRRNIFALAGLNGYTLRGDVSYRLTRRQTVTASYSHSYYDFQRQFGNSTLNTGAIGYSVGLNRSWDFSSQVGVTFVNSLGLQQVALDPAIAAIVGVSEVTTTFARTVRVPVLEARVIRRFSQAQLSFDASSRVVPGDGVFLTSRKN